MRHRLFMVGYLLTLLSLTVLGLPRAARAAATQQIYTDSLLAGWQNWSWCATDFNSRDYVHGGSASLKATITAAWQGMSLHTDTAVNFTTLTFWINGGATNGRNLSISGLSGSAAVGNYTLNQFIAGGSVAANSWRLVTVPLSALQMDKVPMNGFWLQDNSGGPQAAFYIDDITLSGTAGTTSIYNINVDAQANQRAINRQIYGVAYASEDQLYDLNVALNRQGGNSATRYNWQQNASNHASDYFFESISDGSSTPGDVVDSLINGSINARAQAMVTIPTIGWVAKLGPNRGNLASFSINKYGAQSAHDGWMPDAGNGVKTNGQNVTGNDPKDANVAADSTFAQSWVKHITGLFGTASQGGLTYYILDNEPSIWHGTHRDVHPTGATMDEVESKIIDYAAKIKAVDSGAQIVGPEEWGWSGYFYSGYDQQYGGAHGWSSLPDRNNHGGADYMPWVLNSLHTYDTANKTKSLDVFSLHYYPQGGEFGNDTTTAMQLRRNRSTRSLWDPNYVDETWIGTQVQLIPRMKSWVSSYYPGLKTALTEYSWGADAHINGATAQADALGIFGREGLDMAARWTVPSSGTPSYNAIKMYTNVDANNGGFGDTSVSDVATDPDNLSSFAALRGRDGALTVMLINKSLSNSAQTTVNLANFTPGASAQVWQLTSANTIANLSDATVTKAVNAAPSVALTLPAQSITLVIVPKAQTASSAATTVKFVGTDTSTQGNWKTKYGKDGYNVIGDATSIPSYAGVNTTGQLFWRWADNPSEYSALQKSNSTTGRIAACWYGSKYTVDVNFTDGNTHQVSLYNLDYSNSGRTQTIDVLDAGTNAVLDTQTLSSFSNGKYLVWNIKGHVKFRVTNTGPYNAVLSGLFFDAQGSFAAASSPNTATFVKTDTTTQGGWKGAYGTAGYNVINNAVSYPTYASVSASGNSSWTWNSSTSETPALQKAGTATDRIAACWYNATSFTVDVNLTDSKSHQVSLYNLDYQNAGRTETIDVLDAGTNAVLDTQNVSSFSNGKYLVWNIKGHVKFRVTNTGPYNAVISGLFFD